MLNDRGVGLGCRRLSIIDLETGDQPLFNEDRSVVVVCNREIFKTSCSGKSWPNGPTSCSLGMRDIAGSSRGRRPSAGCR